MKKLSAFLLSATCLAAVSSASEAQERWPNWYLGLHGSIAFIDDSATDGSPTTDKFSMDTGAGYGASIGYRPRGAHGNWSNMRIEAEWHHQRADIDQVSTTSGTANGDGSVRANAGMLNIFYDAAISMPEWRPYVGAGLGFAQMSLQNASANFGASAEDDTVFAWNLMAGLGYIPPSLPFTEWSVGYRYFSTGSAEFALTNGGTFEIDYDSHNIEAGVKFLF